MPKKKITAKKSKPDIVNERSGENWVYTKEVKDHFFNPRNLLLEDPDASKFDAEGVVGSPACGDVMRIWIKVDPKKDKIIDLKWRTFGCASAIAATSMLSLMVTEKKGMTISKALTIKPQDIIRRLGGMPDRKIHCSVLGDKALRAAINDWFKKSGQYERVLVEGSRIIDPSTKVTDADIETAVIEGAKTIDDLQRRTKVGIGNPEVIPDVEELLKFYLEKYFRADGK